MDTCGDDETDVHYFERCLRYTDIRTEARSKVPNLLWCTQYIYHGYEEYTEEDNIALQLAGQFYIDKTERFN